MSKMRSKSLILESLYEIGIALTSNLNMGEVLDEVGKNARQVLGADRAACHLYNSETGMYSLASDVGDRVNLEINRVPRTGGPTDWIVTRKEVLYSNNAQEDETPYQDSPFTKAEDYHSVLGLPLKKGDEIVGVLYINYRELNMITDEVIQIGKLFANQAAVAIYNTNLFSNLSEKEKAMSRLVEVGHKISEAIARPQSLDADPGVKQVLKDIARVSCELTGADCSVFYPFDASRKEFYDIKQVGAWGLRTVLNLSDKPRSVGGMAAYIHQFGMLKVENISIEEPKMLESDFICRENVQAFIGIDVCIEDDRLGVLYVNFRKPTRFSLEDENTIKHFANQAGLAIQIARIIEREQRERLNLEILSLMDSIGGAFVHRVIGDLGTVPVLARRIRQRLVKYGIEDDVIKDAITQIEEDSSRVLQKTSILRKLKEIQGVSELININEHLTSIATSRVKPPMALVSELYQSLPLINVPRQQVVEIIENIVNNAIEHMPSDGTLTISTNISGREWLDVNIKDTGPGLSKEKQQKIFELFYSEKQGGLGFGLWWSRTVMRRLGGDIIVASEKGKGSTFTLRIPSNLIQN